MKRRILVVDDEKNIRRTLALILQGAGYELREASSGEEALTLLEELPPDLVLLDVGLPGQDGIAILKEVVQRHPGLPVVMISGQATIALAVEATRAGAFDFLEKPLSKERVLLAVRNALQLGSLGQAVHRHQSTEARRWVMVGQSPALEEIRRTVQKVGPSSATVLITGESGTGKELVARAFHEASPRRLGPFIKVNCAAIPEELIETELFGCVRGAFTGADRTRDGKFLLADTGTLFLDEIGDMSLRVQAKVLRVLQEGELERVGDSQTLRTDVRVLAATNKDLADEVKGGRFREDLYYRLNVVPFRVPPLRERPEDVPLLCEHFLQLDAVENDRAPKRLSRGAIHQLESLPWKGNIRELRNVLERLALLSEGQEITEEDVQQLAPEGRSSRSSPLLPSYKADGDASGSPEASLPAASPEAIRPEAIRPEAIRSMGGLVQARRAFERLCIEACLDRSGGNVSEAARWLGIERSNLHKKMQAHGLEARPPRPGSRDASEEGEDPS